MPLDPGWLADGVGLLPQLLGVVLAERALPRLERLADGVDGLHLAHRHELHGRGIAPGSPARLRDPLADAGEVRGYPHGVLRPASARSASVSTIGSPTTLEKLPSMRSMNAPARPWIP